MGPPAPVKRKGGRSSLPSIASQPVQSQEEEPIASSSKPNGKPLRRRQTLSNLVKSSPKGKGASKTEPDFEEPSSISPSKPNSPTKASPAKNSRKNKADAAVPESAPPFKRIKLIHRVPPPSYTHPDQRPPKPQFSGSLTSYLQSYVRLEDEGPDLTPEQLAKNASIDGVHLRRIAELRNHGRLSNPKGAIAPSPEPIRQKVDWDRVVETAVISSKAVREAGKLRVGGSRRVAKLITAHWEKVAGADDKQRRAEEKRLQALVKSTLKLVLSQWKDAVKVGNIRTVLYRPLCLPNPISLYVNENWKKPRPNKTVGENSTWTRS